MHNVLQVTSGAKGEEKLRWWHAVSRFKSVYNKLLKCLEYDTLATRKRNIQFQYTSFQSLSFPVPAQ